MSPGPVRGHIRRWWWAYASGALIVTVGATGFWNEWKADFLMFVAIPLTTLAIIVSLGAVAVAMLQRNDLRPTPPDTPTTPPLPAGGATMGWTDELHAVRLVLTKIYDKAEDARELALSSGALARGRVAERPTANNQWVAILQRGLDQGRPSMEVLLRHLVNRTEEDEHPHELAPQLRAAVEAYLVPVAQD